MTKLGRSDIDITPIGIGAWQFSEGKAFNGVFWDALSAEVTNDIIKTAIEQKINWFDTAEAYGFGRSEAGLSRGLDTAGIGDDQIKIATKWFPLFRFARNIARNIHKRLQRLEPYSIDLFQIHQPWSFSTTKAEMNQMADLVDKQLIKTVGVSNFMANKMRSAFEHLETRGHPLVSNQVKYSLLDRNIESSGVLETVQELNISIIAYSPLEQGLLTGKFHDNPELLENRPFVRRRLLKKSMDRSRQLVDTLQAIARETGATASQVALNWLITYHNGVVAIPGASKTQHVIESAGAMEVELSKEQMNSLEEESQDFL